MFKQSKKHAFTMIELIFVIMIMGILGKFGTEFLASAYENFISTKINNNLQETSASALELISARLKSRIKPSVIARNTTTGTYNYVNGSGLTDTNATVLEWIATDIDSFRGDSSPFWSGVIDLDPSVSNATKLLSPGSNFNATSLLMSKLSPAGNSLNGAAIYFLNSPDTANPWGYKGAITTQSQRLHPIKKGTNNDELAPLVSNFSGQEVYEYYKLASTAYAIELGDYDETKKIGNLYLYYDYRPWLGETYTANGTKVLLAKGINTFRFLGRGSMIKIQVCAKSDLQNEEYALCKEKTIY